MLDIDLAPLYAVFVLVVSVVCVGRHQGSVIVLTRCVHISVCIVCCHIAATETSPADCGEDGALSQSGVVLPLMESFTRLSRLAFGFNRMDRLEWSAC
jgi:hypothetical protein